MNEQSFKQCCNKYFSFRSILVGAFVAFGLVFLFNLLTLGGGLAAYTHTEKGLEALIFASYLWIIVGSFAIFFVAGLITTWIMHNEVSHYCHSLLYGFCTWVLYLLITMAFLSSATDSSVVTFPKYFTSVTADTVVSASRHGDLSLRSQTAPNATTNPNVRKEAHKVGLATLAAFFVFFVQVIGSCFGAWCGTECKRCAPGCKCNRCMGECNTSGYNRKDV